MLAHKRKQIWPNCLPVTIERRSQQSLPFCFPLPPMSSCDTQNAGPSSLAAIGLTSPISLCWVHGPELLHLYSIAHPSAQNTYSFHPINYLTRWTSVSKKKTQPIAVPSLLPSLPSLPPCHSPRSPARRSPVSPTSCTRLPPRTAGCRRPAAGPSCPSAPRPASAGRRTSRRPAAPDAYSAGGGDRRAILAGLSTGFCLIRIIQLQQHFIAKPTLLVCYVG